MITKVYYSVYNGGDGSAYPIFFESEKSSDFHQYLLNESGSGWGEDCVGVLEIESDGPVKVKEIITDEEYSKLLYSEIKYYSDSPLKKEVEDFINEIQAGIREAKIDEIIKE